METNITETFKKIYEEQSDPIFRFCLTRVSNREQAKDLTQETFLRLWKSLLEGEELRNSRAYLFTISHRLIIDWYRKKKSISLDKMLLNNEGEHSDFIDENTTTDNIEIGAEGRFLLDKIDELSETYRDPVYLRYVEDLPPEEIGKILNISTNATSVRINRGIEELRKITGYNNINK